MKKIYGIDWSRIKETELVTCAQDGLVKIWDYTQPRSCLSAIHTGAPVWRARYTPFGNYLVTMPQRKDNSLYLWDCDDLTEPVFVFSGHTDVPTEFVWRIGRSEENVSAIDYQLVTWGKDQNLRLWPLDLRDLRGVSADSETFTTIQPRLSILEEEGISRNSSLSGAQVRIAQADDTDIMLRPKELESPILPLIHESSVTPTYAAQPDYHWEQLMSSDIELKYHSIEREIQILEQSIQNLTFEKIGPSYLHYGYVLFWIGR
jgi:WD40 repeat protein